VGLRWFVILTFAMHSLEAASILDRSDQMARRVQISPENADVAWNDFSDPAISTEATQPGNH
jgi:hypothetical protein